MIWFNNPNDLYKLKKLKDSHIQKAEKILEIQLPKEYIEILKEQNGGGIVYNAFPSPKPTAWDETSGYIDHIFGIGEEPGILDTPYYIQEWEMPEGIVLFSGDGSEWIAFDYRNTKSNPPIIYLNNDSNEIITVADTFSEFISKLFLQETIEEIFEEEPQVTQPEVEQFIKENRVEELILAIDRIAWDIDEMDQIDLNWYTDKLIQLSHHNDSYLRQSVIDAANVLDYLIDKETLTELINILKNDSNIDVLRSVNLLKEKI